MYANIPETVKVYEFYGTLALEAAASFYEKSPDGQYDELAAELIRALLKDMAVGP